MTQASPGAGDGTALELTVSSDGQVCIPASRLHEVALVHLVSGLDDTTAAEHEGCDCSTTLSGYTEWVNASSLVTIGWDWQLEAASLTLSRTGPPSSNLVLYDEAAADISAKAARQLLARFVDNTDWQKDTFGHLSKRYR